MIRVGIIGVTGYVGIETFRMLLAHPEVKITQAVTHQYVGEDISKIYPHLGKQGSLIAKKLDINVLIEDCDVIFVSLPHGEASKFVQPLLQAGKRIIDLGPDFRLKNPSDYEKWYRLESAPIEMLNQAVYGLPEVTSKEAIAKTNLLANPGCNSTAALLATYPALKHKIIHPNEFIYDVKVSTSAGGRKPELTNHHAEMSDNIWPYRLAGAHRHTPEIEQELSLIAQERVLVQCSMHLLGMTRGLLVTSYFKLIKPMTAQEVHNLYSNTYAQEPFIRILPLYSVAKIKDVRGTNYCDMSIHVDMRTQRLIVLSVIDNLIKGAGGQGVQNMNLMYQLPQTMSLDKYICVYP